jgi:hypothetical protein
MNRREFVESIGALMVAGLALAATLQPAAAAAFDPSEQSIAQLSAAQADGRLLQIGRVFERARNARQAPRLDAPGLSAA